jgi:hypothetical protein
MDWLVVVGCLCLGTIIGTFATWYFSVNLPEKISAKSPFRDHVGVSRNISDGDVQFFGRVSRANKNTGFTQSGCSLASCV